LQQSFSCFYSFTVQGVATLAWLGEEVLAALRWRWRVFGAFAGRFALRWGMAEKNGKWMQTKSLAVMRNLTWC